MGTVIQYAQCGNADRQQRWERSRRAELLDQYGSLQAQGVSQRQAAKALDIPRTTLQAWRAWPGFPAPAGPGAPCGLCRGWGVWDSPGVSLVRGLGGCAATHVEGTVEVLRLAEVFVTLALTSFLWTTHHF